MARRLTRVEGLERLKRRLADLSEGGRAEILKANQRNAEEFADTVRQIIPKGEPADGNLVDTLEVKAGETETGVLVTIGGPDQPHPLHLEAGHRNADGSHTPPKPYWNPAKRVLRKRARGRAGRALSKAIKDVTHD
jgi:hypothetical protein